MNINIQLKFNFLTKCDLKEDGILKDNHNSIDLTELEMLDDNDEDPRQPHQDIIQVRSDINYLKFEYM